MRIYHNPRCSKSRNALSLLEERGITPEVIHYLDEPLSESQLSTILEKLGLRASELVRRSENLYREKFAAHDMTEAEWLTALAENPSLIERPIVIDGKRAVLARPPEKLLKWLDQVD